jgi:hypothetical protein
MTRLRFWIGLMRAAGRNRLVAPRAITASSGVVRLSYGHDRLASRPARGVDVPPGYVVPTVNGAANGAPAGRRATSTFTQLAPRVSFSRAMNAPM